MSNQKTCAIYVRTSTADKQNPDGQESELRALVEKRGWRVFKVYRDHGFSGAKAIAQHSTRCGWIVGQEGFQSFAFGRSIVSVDRLRT